MKKKLLLFVATSLIVTSNKATTIYSQNFNLGLPASGWINNDLTSPWASTSFATISNIWQCDDNESGQPAGSCGTLLAGNNSLYVGFPIGIGCAYFASAATNRRIGSPNINTTGYSNIVLSFNFIAEGDPTNDKGYLQYSIDGGVNWLDATGAPTSANPALPSGSNLNNLKSDNTSCAPQGTWTNITWNMPSTCANISNLRVAFVWQNNTDASATDPAIAVDDVTITGTAGSNSITTSPLSSLTYCAGAVVVVPYSTTGVYTSGNVFTAQLSDAVGSFASPTAIGTLSSTGSGAVSSTIPSLTPAGTGYRIRVVSSTPAIVGTDNGSNITINVRPSIVSSPSFVTICAGDTAYLPVVASGSGLTYQWMKGVATVVNGGNTTGATSTALTMNPAVVSNSGTYTLVVTGTCSPTATTPPILLTVNALPVVTLSASLPDSVCSNATPFVLFGGSPLGGAYAIDGITSTTFTPSALSLGSHLIVYSYTDAISCAGADSQYIFIQTCTTTSMPESRKNELFHVFPNPTSGRVMLESMSSLSVTYEVFNVLGASILKHTMIEKDVLELNSGIYFVRFDGECQKPLKIVVY